MSLRPIPENAPAEYVQALEAIRAVAARPEVLIEEIPAPTRIAPFAAAFSAEVEDAESSLGSGRFVLLHDATQEDIWNGRFRAVTFARAALEDDVASDPMLAGVGWAWLTEALHSHGAQFVAEGGTVTRVHSESFGSLADKPRTIEVEVRASWTVLGDVGAHFEAWMTLVSTAAGLEPLPEGVTALHRRSS